ncbi:MAG: hypothetical protein KAQ64_02595 [Candidatus Pacebacteria bacterium]|nr:hypothetical protein [Candidatus Paceibacterota bacterium]
MSFLKMLKKLWSFITPQLPNEEVTELSNEEVTENYLEAGAEFGSAIGPMGECVGFEKMLNEWARWELEYAERGFKTIPIDVFADSDFGFYKEMIKKFVGVRRDSIKKPIYHAEIFREIYLGRIKPVVDLGTPEIQVGNYLVPTTLGYRDPEEYD